MKRKIAVVLTNRSNYGRMKPVMQALKEHPMIELLLFCTGTMVLERFGRPVDLCKEDGFEVHAEIYTELEGDMPTSMAKSIGTTITEIASVFNIFRPEFLLIIGDRYEALGVVITASYMGVCVAHIQGGEVSGTLDESARHAITKMAHYHFPSTQRAYEYLIKMGESSGTVFNVGCPVGDISLNLNKNIDLNPFKGRGIGIEINHLEPYILAIFHPDTCDFGNEERYTEEIVNAFNELKMPVCWLWANIDTGGGHINAYLRRVHEYANPSWLQLVKNFTPELYQVILARSACAVGNSSSFVRDSSFYGTPVVLVGDRQKGREKGSNCINVSYKKDLILDGVRKQLDHGHYVPSKLYGDGNASSKIADILSSLPVYHQKRLSYVNEDS